jgi:hypothetical protein
LKLRDLYHLSEEEEDKKTIAYSDILDKLSKLEQIESPMCKLEHIYKCCTLEIQMALDAFWQDYDIPSKKLSIDADNLQSIIVYFLAHLDGFP